MAKKPPQIKSKAHADRHPATYNCFRITIVIAICIFMVIISFLIIPAVWKVLDDATSQEAEHYLVWFFTAIVMPLIGFLGRPYIDKFTRED